MLTHVPPVVFTSVMQQFADPASIPYEILVANNMETATRGTPHNDALFYIWNDINAFIPPTGANMQQLLSAVSHKEKEYLRDTLRGQLRPFPLYGFYSFNKMLPSTGSRSLSASQPLAYDPMSLMNAAGSNVPIDSNQQISKLSTEISDLDVSVATKKAQYFVAMDIYEKDIVKLEINDFD